MMRASTILHALRWAPDLLISTVFVLAAAPALPITAQCVAGWTGLGITALLSMDLRAPTVLVWLGRARRFTASEASIIDSLTRDLSAIGLATVVAVCRDGGVRSLSRRCVVIDEAMLRDLLGGSDRAQRALIAVCHIRAVAETECSRRELALAWWSLPYRLVARGSHLTDRVGRVGVVLTGFAIAHNARLDAAPPAARWAMAALIAWLVLVAASRWAEHTLRVRAEARAEVLTARWQPQRRSRGRTHLRLVE